MGLGAGFSRLGFDSGSFYWKGRKCFLTDKNTYYRLILILKETYFKFPKPTKTHFKPEKSIIFLRFDSQRPASFGYFAYIINNVTTMIFKTKALNQLIAFSCCILFSSAAFNQQDFNNFATLKAAGNMPEDFSTSTRDKIKNDIGTRQQLSEKNEMVFLSGIHYSIDELLHSGLVIYGDEISNYVSRVAGNLLKNDPDLRSKLRFYTLKSNMTNAFSTDQGIVFVTTGLISQLTSESQLANVLAHEISHYTQHHVVETFDFNNTQPKREYHDRIFKLSNYSREKEFEADRLGIKLYNEAGYSKNDLIGCFDVLLYSYLPFEDVKVPANYFNTDLAFIPERYFPKKEYPIKAEEDQDDSQSTHPNIKKRKEAAEKEIANYSNWGNERFIFGENEFLYIRNICRFESVRTDILDGRFVDALYSILVLEQSFPQSHYLQTMKAHAWLGFAQIAYKRDEGIAIMKVHDLEGEIAAMHYLFGKINSSAIGTLALRYITDIRAKNPENAEIDNIWKKMVKTVAREYDFDISKFSAKSFKVASGEFFKTKSDTIVKKDTTAQVTETKYERIKKKKTAAATETFDSTAYEIYLLSDLVESEEFKTLYDGYKEEFKKEDAKDDSLDNLSNKEIRRYWLSVEKNKYNKGINDLIVVQPTAEIVRGRYSESDPEKNKKAEENMIVCVKEISKDLDMNIRMMNTTSEFVTSTDDFNNRSRIFSYLEQSANNRHKDLLPVDIEDLNLIKSQYNTSNVAFIHYTQYYDIRKGWLLSILAGGFPAIVTYPETFLHGFKGRFSFVVMDIASGEIVLSRSDRFTDPNTKNAVRARIYNVLRDVQQAPKTSKR